MFKLSGKFTHTLSKLSWKYGNYIYCRNWNIRNLVKWVKYPNFSIELFGPFHEKTHNSASEMDRVAKFWEKMVKCLKKLSWKFGLSIYYRSRDMRILVSGYVGPKNFKLILSRFDQKIIFEGRTRRYNARTSMVVF